MIEVRLQITIRADDDDEADAVLAGIRELGVPYPATPIVSMFEESRELVRP